VRRRTPLLTGNPRSHPDAPPYPNRYEPPAKDTPWSGDVADASNAIYRAGRPATPSTRSPLGATCAAQ
jgi:hypothetical protein